MKLGACRFRQGIELREDERQAVLMMLCRKGHGVPEGLLGNMASD